MAAKVEHIAPGALVRDAIEYTPHIFGGRKSEVVIVVAVPQVTAHSERAVSVKITLHERKLHLGIAERTLVLFYKFAEFLQKCTVLFAYFVVVSESFIKIGIL